MRKLMILGALGAAAYAFARWWRRNRRAGTQFVNRIVNPWLDRRGLITGSRGELALVEHVGRRTGTVRRTPIHPMETADGYRIIVPVGEQSEWARNVLAAGHCRLVIGERVLDLDRPALETPSEVPGLPGPVCALFEWLGFRYLRLHNAVGAAPAVEEPVGLPVPELEAVPA